MLLCPIYSNNNFNGRHAYNTAPHFSKTRVDRANVFSHSYLAGIHRLNCIVTERQAVAFYLRRLLQDPFTKEALITSGVLATSSRH
jgi:hypothetical protein